MAAFPVAQSVERADAYQPAETVRGGKALPLETAPTGAIAAAALDRAQAYAEAQNSFAFIVAKDGRIVRERYWSGFGPDSRFSTASMHKSVLALAFGPAVARGRIALDQPVGRYITEWKDDPRGRITIRQLLTMSSGLETPPFSPLPTSLGAQLMFSNDINAIARRFQQAQPPGTEFAYANVNPQLAGAALTRAVGMRYSEWLSRNLWAPIGASDAALWLDRPGGAPHFFCCLQASARDWMRIGELIRNRGKVGSRQVIAADWIDQVTAASPLNPNYGMQVWRGSPFAAERRYGRTVALTVKSAAPFAAEDVLFLDGAGGQRVYVIPSKGLTIVRIGKPAMNWDDTAMPNMVLAGLN
jgi:CubicO group peptidase (beta-lactamase class C family)